MRNSQLAENDAFICEEAFAAAAFQAYWSDDQDISQESVLAVLCEKADIDADAFFSAITQ